VHIGLDVSSMPRERVGAGYYMHNLVAALAGVDVANQYHLLARRSLLPDLPAGGGNLRVDGLAPESRALRLLWEQTALPVLLARHRIDLLHSMHYTIPVAVRTKRVVTFHDMTFFLYPGVHTAQKRLFFGAMMRLSARLADAVIAVSESTRQDILRILGVDPAKVFAVPSGVSPAFRPAAEPSLVERVRGSYHLPDRIVLYVGVLEPRKNLPALVRAFKGLVDRGLPHALVLVGRKGWMYGDLFRTVEELGLSGRVIFTGYVPEGDLPLLYNAADLFVYPSIYEGFGLPVLEAMASGVPVVTSNVSSMPEVAGDAAVVVDPRDVEGLEGAMHRILTDGALREDLAHRGVERAGLFSWERTARGTLAVYERVMGRQMDSLPQRLNG